MYLNDKVNIALTTDERQKVIGRAAGTGSASKEEADDRGDGVKVCALHQDKGCLLHQYRPLHCRMRGFLANDPRLKEIHEELDLLSREVFTALFHQETDTTPPAVSCPDSVSGKFIQDYFHYLAARKRAL